MDALGIDPKLMLAQIINFVILLFLLNRFLYKPITKILLERKEKIAEGIKESEKSKAQLELATKEAEKIREKAYKEANDILQKAKNEANKEAAEIVKKASSQVQKSMDALALEKATYKEKVMSEVKKETGDIVILALNKIVGKEITEEEKKRLTERAIKEL